MSIIELPPLGPERWGDKVGRARRRKGVKFREARDRIAPVLPMSHAAIANLEDRTEAPTVKRQRYLAYLLAHIYQCDPRELEVGPEDVPPGFDPEDIVKRLLPPPGGVTMGYYEPAGQRLAA